MSDHIPHKILVAIDFGTTYTAVSWCLTAAAENVAMITRWPNQKGGINNKTADCVPTVLLYSPDGKTLVSWGSQVPEDKPCLKHFKLGLSDICEQESKLLSYLKIQYPDEMEKPLDHEQKPEKLVTDFLQKLHAHIISCIETAVGKAAVKTTPIEYVLTVPAIWGDKAKEKTRLCARNAGFGENIHMISEPEAAVTWALGILEPGTLNEGDTFVLVDAGGGTGDLISYVVDSIGQVSEVREAAPGSGDICGSSFLNHIFRKFMFDRFEEVEDFDGEVLEEALRRFELCTKREYHGREEEDETFAIPVPGIRQIKALNVHNGKLLLKKREMEDIFEKVINPMITLVTNQIKATKTRVKAVILVGGFGQSPYLKYMIEKAVHSLGIEVLQPENGHLAVVKGAMIRGLALNSKAPARVAVRSRVARKAFGMHCGPIFDAEKHLVKDRYWSAYQGKYLVRAIEWFIRKGDVLKEEVPVVHRFYMTRLRSEGTFTDEELTIWAYDKNDSDNPAEYPRPTAAKQHVILQAKLSEIPKKDLNKYMGKDRKSYWKLDYEIRIKFFSAHTEYSLWYNDKCYGNVKAKYE